MADSETLYCSSKFPWARERISSKQTIWGRALKKLHQLCHRHSSVGTVTTLQVGRPRNRRFPEGSKDFYLLRNVQTASGPAQLPIQWVLEDLLLGGERGRSVKPTNHLQEMPRLKTCETMPPFPHTPSWYAQG
jgi:hypothetical protein